MTLARKLDLAWATLESGNETQALVRTLDDFNLGTNASVGIDDKQSRELLIEIPPNADVGSAPKVHGVRASVRTTRTAGSIRKQLVLRCADRASRRVFTQFSADLLEQVAGAANVPAKVMEVLASWRDMFRGLSEASEHHLRGVFGELHELGEMTRYSNAVIEAWHGPDHLPQDFRRGETAVEVKSTRSPAQSVEVHGIHQLSPVGLQHLVLAVKHVALDPSGRTMLELAEDLVTRGVDRSLLWQKLEELDLSHDKLCENAGPRFVVRSTRYYTIDESSPVLSAASLKTGALPSAVSKLCYLLDLSSISPCEAERVEAVHRRLGGA